MRKRITALAIGLAAVSAFSFATPAAAATPATAPAVNYLVAGWQLDLALLTQPKVVVLTCTLLSGSCRSIESAYPQWAAAFPDISCYIVDVGFASPDLLARVLKAGLPTTNLYLRGLPFGRVVGPDVVGILSEMGLLHQQTPAA